MTSSPALILAAAAHDLLRLGRADLARPVAALALEADAAVPNCHSVMAGVLEEGGDWDGALRCWREAARLAPESPGHRHNLAVALMVRGAWAEAAPHYAMRLEKADWSSLAAAGSLDGVRHLLPGAGPPGRRALVFTEQGLGDCVWAARWLPMLAGATLATRPELAPLLARIAPGMAQLGPPAERPEAKINLAALAGRFDAVVPMMSLPFLMGAAPVPYLAADPAAVAAWRARYAAALPGRRIVGVVWRASPGNASSPRRSVPADALAPLAGRAGFVNLQGGPAEGRAALGAVLPDIFDALAGGEPPLDDFAAAIAATDLLVTVDTMAAHLAGAMGHPAHVLVPAVPHFYWGVSGEACRWYPSLRLFRQPVGEGWDMAVQALAAAV